jgi:hypothetical protein
MKNIMDGLFFASFVFVIAGNFRDNEMYVLNGIYIMLLLIVIIGSRIIYYVNKDGFSARAASIQLT